MTEGALLALLQPFNPVLAEHPRLTQLRADARPQMSLDSRGIATIPISGSLMRKPSLWETWSGRAEDTDALTSLVHQAANDSNVSGILLAVDSPGGMFNGGLELADAVRSARMRKPVVSHVSGLGASLAYMVASQSDAIVASPSASVGSIGVIAAHADMTQFFADMGVKLEIFRSAGADLKAPGIYGTSLTDSQRESIQSSVDKVGQIFASTVTRARPKAKLEGLRGRTFLADDAADLGLIDYAGNDSFAKAIAMNRKMV